MRPCCLGRRPSRRASSARIGIAQSSSSRSRPATTRGPSTTPRTPETLDVRERRRPAGARRLARARRVGDRPRDRVLGRVFERADAAATPRRRSSRPSTGDDLDERHAAGRDRAGLVEHDRVDPARRLEDSGPLIRMPSCAPRPVPTSSAVGVARPSAHGQAMISTATAAVNASSAALRRSAASTRACATASTITIGTKTAETRSASRWTGALPGLRVGDEPRDLGEGGVGRRPASPARRGDRRR